MSGFLAAAGVLIAAAAGAAAILLPPGRSRALAMLVAIALFPVLIAGDQWHSHQIVDLRDHPGRLLALAVTALAASAVLAAAFRRWPSALPLAIVAALPLRVPLHAGGETANLLVPLYLVIAGGVLCDGAAGVAGGRGGRCSVRAASCFRTAGLARETAPRRKTQRARRDTPTPSTLLPYVLAGVVVLYALQTLYSPDFSKSLQNVCFFFVPFSLVYALLRDVRWDRKLLTLVLWVVALEAVAFVAVGSVEYATRSLFWNAQVIRSNEFHTYFRVNSIFWDPNIYGRYLALAIVVAMAALLWARERRTPGAAHRARRRPLARPRADLLAVELRRPAGGPCRPCRACAGAALDAQRGGGSSRPRDLGRALRRRRRRSSASIASTSTPAAAPTWSAAASTSSPSARSGVTASGSFPKAYREHVRTQKVPVSVSHTEPITVAAEQGVIGLVAYAALLVAAVWTMASGLLVSSKRGGGPGGGWSVLYFFGNSPAASRPRSTEKVKRNHHPVPHHPDDGARGPYHPCRKGRRPGSLHRPPRPHDGLRGLLRGPDRVGAAGGGGVADGGARGPRRHVVSGRVGLPPPPRDDRRRLHRGEHPLEADRGRAAAALHALPDPGRLRRRRGDVRGRRLGQHRRPLRDDRGAAALLLQGRRGPGAGRLHLLRGALLARHRGGAARAALRRADLRSAARTGPPPTWPGSRSAASGC